MPRIKLTIMDISTQYSITRQNGAIGLVCISNFKKGSNTELQGSYVETTPDGNQARYSLYFDINTRHSITLRGRNGETGAWLGMTSREITKGLVSFAAKNPDHKLVPYLIKNNSFFTAKYGSLVKLATPVEPKRAIQLNLAKLQSMTLADLMKVKPENVEKLLAELEKQGKKVSFARLIGKLRADKAPAPATPKTVKVPTASKNGDSPTPAVTLPGRITKDNVPHGTNAPTPAPVTAPKDKPEVKLPTRTTATIGLGAIDFNTDIDEEDDY